MNQLNQLSHIEHSFADFLKEELSRRVDRNPSYSLRAFARDIELSPSRLSEVMSGKHGISRSSARIICKSLGLAQSKIEYWCDVVDAKFARCDRLRAQALRRLKKAHNEPELYEFSGDEFSLISDWYHLAILELMKVKSFEPSVAWISECLKIGEQTAFEAIGRLERLELISIDDDGAWHLVVGRSSVGDRVSPAAMRVFHTQILGKATQAISDYPRSERNLQAIVSAISTQGYRELTEAMHEFQTRVLEISQKYQGKDKVIAFAMQAFPLMETKEPKDDHVH